MSALPQGVAATATALGADAVMRRIDDQVVLDGVSFAVERGEHFALLGAAGGALGAIVRIALGLERADAGRATLLGRDPAALRGPARRDLLAQVGVLLARDALFEDRSVEENVALGVRGDRPREAAGRAVREALLLVGLKHLEHRRPPSLSSGERRRVALARAVAGSPALLVVEEPAASLDPVAAGAIHALLAQLRKRLALTLFVATSDPRAIADADRVAFLHRGRIAAVDAPERLRGRGDAALQQLLAGRPWGPLAP